MPTTIRTVAEDRLRRRVANECLRLATGLSLANEHELAVHMMEMGYAEARVLLEPDRG